MSSLRNGWVAYETAVQVVINHQNSVATKCKSILVLNCYTMLKNLVDSLDQTHTFSHLRWTSSEYFRPSPSSAST